MRAAPPSTEAPAIELEHVSIALGARRVITDLSLRIERGEFTTLLGANGSGKSTVLRAAVGILPLAAGTARVFGTSVVHRRAHSQIGYVPQYAAEAASTPATAREMVATGLLDPRRWVTSSRRTEILTALEKVGMHDLADRPVTHMSGGQRQRVMIARALVSDPDLLVLDEPFSGVDLSSQEIISGIFRALHHEGKTLVVVLHNLGTLAHELSRSIVLDEGDVIYDGPPLEVPHGTIGHEHDHDIPEREDHGLGQEMTP